MADLNPHNLLNVLLHHLEVPATFIPGSLLLGAGAWRLAARRGWARVPAVLAGCGLALALAVTVVRPPGQFPSGRLNPLMSLRLCTVGSLSLAHLYEQLNVAMLVPFACFGTLALRRPLLILASCVVFSALAEFVQASTGGGECQLRDVLHNSLGGALGVLLAGVVLAVRVSRARRWARVNPDAAAGSAAPP